ncbi:MAG: hypothetical protein DRI61_15595 [Chloroflexi bacterium]|nr:MAG: hypothetical protein DRI61_15595 [Chloroflexota bacterium]
MKQNKKESRSVRIDLDEEWKLGSDSMQWILYKKAKEKEDEILDEEIVSKSTWKKEFVPTGYFTTLENALKAYIDAKLRNSAAKSVKELYDYHREILQSLNEVLKPFEIVIKSDAK